MSKFNKIEIVESVFSDEERRWRMLKFKVLEQQIADAFKVFRENGVEPILIKGWAASRNYPEKYERFFSDIDLAVAPDVYASTLALLEDKKLLIDLHCGLRHLDTVEWEILYKNSVTEKLSGTDVRILSEEDHLRVLAVHWLTDGGAYKDKLRDIVYAVAKRSDNFDWHRCLDAVGSKRRLWIIHTIGLAHRFYDLDISGLPFEKEAKQLPKWLIKTCEREWATTVRLRPLHTCLNDWREVLRQLIKRIPPNAIQATIEAEGDFDEKTRIFYQLSSFCKRIKPSVSRIFSLVLKK